MKFLQLIIFFYLVIFSAESNTNIPVKYIDLNRIVNESIVGKQIKDLIVNERKKFNKKHQDLEKKLEKNKNDILSKKNILSEEDFQKEVDNHQKNINDYQLEKKQNLDKMNRKNLEYSRNFMIKIDKIVLEYSKNNSIDLLLKKDALIVSNSSLDITNEILTEVDNKIKKID